jgi:hypothetical protein
MHAHWLTTHAPQVEVEMPFANGSAVTWFVLQRRQLNNFNKTQWGEDLRIDDVAKLFEECVCVYVLLCVRVCACVCMCVRVCECV